MNIIKLHVFKSGTHTSSAGQTLTFSDDDVRAIRENYSPAIHEAPLVVGHPSTDDPAYGWVEHCDYKNGELWVEAHQVDGAFLELLKAGRFKKISVALYAPDDPNNPIPGDWYLRHVGFLGAAAPAVKGLRQAAFSDRPAFSDRAPIVFEEAVGAPAPASGSTTAGGVRTSMDEKEKLAAALEAAQQELAAAKVREQQYQKEREAHCQAAAASFAENMVAQGRVLSAQKTRVTDLVVHLERQPEPVQFGEKQERLVDVFKGLLQELPVFTPSKGEFAPDASKTPVAAAFSAAPGYTVNSEQLELHGRALAYAKQHKVEYMEAVQAVLLEVK